MKQFPREIAVARRAAALALLALAAGCAPRPRPPAPLAPLPIPALAADSVAAETIAAGVTLHRLWAARGPWAIRVLDVDRAACWTLAPLKAGGRAAGRAPTSALAADAQRDRPNALVAGAVNADFFLFVPPGVPLGPHIADGVVLTGPARGRPAIVVDDTGRVTVEELALEAGAVGVIDRWNQPHPEGVALLDDRYGAPIDSARRTVFALARVLRSTRDSVVSLITMLDSGRAQAIAPGEIAIVVGARDTSVRRPLLKLRSAGDTLRVARRIAPRTPRAAIGGNPRLLSRGRRDAAVDTVGSASFRERNPRTAVGIDSTGRRILLVTVDGRQPGYSAGMSLAELADLLRALGAREAINLDGGGSTTMVARSPGGGFRVVNQPSDKEGERAVANALAVVRDQGCP